MMKSLTNTDLLTHVRLCRQRQPLLPSSQGQRTRICVILDILIDGINHNIRKHLDVDLYVTFMDPLFRILSYLSVYRLRLSYHWAELWKSLLGLLRFLASYSDNISRISRVEELADSLVNILALGLSSGEAFLPDEKSYDDLFYKIIESGELLNRFRTAYIVANRTAASNMDMLANVFSHYQSILEEKKGNASKQFSPREVNKLIKEGYNTLSIQSKEGMDQWIRYREADYKNLLKKVTRIAVQDLRTLLAERT